MKLSINDCKWTVEVLPEDMPVKGNFDDKELEAEIIAARNAGSVEAWCWLRVTAKWTAPDGTELDGVDTLGGCSYLHAYATHQPVKAQIAEQADEMKHEALANLQREVDTWYSRHTALKFRDTDAKGYSIGKQATKVDLVDIGRALGLPVTDRMPVPQLRAALRAGLDELNRLGKINPIR